MTLRALRIEDLRAAMALAAEAPEAPHWSVPVWHRVLERSETIVLGAFVAHALAGFAVASVTLDTVELEAIAVAEKHRRQGLGAALFEAVLEAARARGAVRLELEVRAGNAAAIGLYRRAGLADEGVRRAYYRDPEEDALLMGRNLAHVSDKSEKTPD
ncbi:ribosomal-protein-alanine N-acetyltransferase [Silvibacterium dinghuense]|uniref:Ribosomal-protein-alanine N-acetyltransferase n=2 Tax=Silvibacterium dinghuense TaxID=1560006 RepID=A0A4Q1SK84_9BACT|nr:ribosomal-protein-alanine N-acetyltransferase [Silvibacterium dinghuense]